MPISNYLAPSAIAKPGVIANAAARPASPYDGQVVYQQDTDQAYVWNGSAWVLLSTGTANPPGLELITACTATFAGGTAGSVSNGVVTVGTTNTSVTVSNAFSSTYKNYRIVINGLVMSSGGGGLRMSMGTSTSGSGHYYGGFYTDTGTAAVTGVKLANGAHFLIGTSTGTVEFSNSFDILNPFTAARTMVPVVNAYMETGTIGSLSAFHNADTSYTEFIIWLGSGTMSGGTIRVYGYRN